VSLIIATSKKHHQAFVLLPLVLGVILRRELSNKIDIADSKFMIEKRLRKHTVDLHITVRFIDYTDTVYIESLKKHSEGIPF